MIPRFRTHLGLEKDTPKGRSLEPRKMGEVIANPRVGGLHHRYSREFRDAAYTSMPMCRSTGASSRWVLLIPQLEDVR